MCELPHKGEVAAGSLLMRMLHPATSTWPLHLASQYLAAALGQSAPLAYASRMASCGQQSNLCVRAGRPCCGCAAGQACSGKVCPGQVCPGQVCPGQGTHREPAFGCLPAAPASGSFALGVGGAAAQRVCTTVAIHACTAGLRMPCRERLQKAGSRKKAGSGKTIGSAPPDPC